MLIIKMEKKIFLGHSLNSISASDIPNLYIGRFHMHISAHLAPESIRPLRCCLDKCTGVLYVDDCNYQNTNAVIFLCVHTLAIIYRIICGM